MTEAVLIKLTDENREAVFKMALSMYLGEVCQGCNKSFDTEEDLKSAVWWPWEKGRIGHKDCFKKEIKL